MKEIDKWKPFDGCVICEQEVYDGYAGILTIAGSKEKQLVFRIVSMGKGLECTDLKIGDRLMVGNATRSESLKFVIVKVLQRGSDGQWYPTGSVVAYLPAGTEGVEETIQRGKEDKGVRVDGFEP
jgi:hypothetical protein